MEPQHRSSFTIVVDNREKLPYSFEDMETRKLTYGDYTVKGLENKVAIERKSIDDFAKSISGSRRAKFEQNIQIAKKDLEYYAIVIEGNLEDLSNPSNWYNKTSPSSMRGTALKWSAKYGIPVFFCGNRKEANKAVAEILEGASWYYKPDEKKEEEVIDLLVF